jgi:hypothetical protein
MNEVARTTLPLSYADAPFAFKVIEEYIQRYAAQKPMVYVRFADGRGFDVSRFLFSKLIDQIREDPLRLHYANFMFLTGGLIVDFDFYSGLLTASYNLKYEELANELLERITSLQVDSTVAFYEENAEKLMDIIDIEVGRFLIRCIDVDGIIWENPSKKVKIENRVLARVVILALDDVYQEKLFAKRIFEKLFKQYRVAPEEIENRKEVIFDALNELHGKDEIHFLLKDILERRKNLTQLLKVKQVEGCWLLEGKPNSVITALAYETLIVLSKPQRTLRSN